jgi:predicted P-loop ATPase
MQEHPAFPKVWKDLDRGRVMLSHSGEDATEAQTDHTEMMIANYFQHNLGFDQVKSSDIVKVINYLCRENARSPMLDWVKGLDWDGEERLDTWMVRHWGTKDTKFVREASAKWLISSCARMDRPGVKIDWMMIVIGPQGTGKTSMPQIVFRNNSTTLYGEHNDKDLKLLLHSSLCVGFDELDSFGRRESSTLKAMITTNVDVFRPPYGVANEEFPRRFVLYGCGNRYEFLQGDPSGYRRYAIIEVDRKLNFKALEGEVEQLWAEAWHRYRFDPNRYWEVDGASAEAEKHIISNPIQERVIAQVALWQEQRPVGLVVGGKIWFTLATVQVAIGMDPLRGNTMQNRDLGAILASLYGKPELKRGPQGVGRYYVVD